jgi:hypothetical protein
MFLTLGPVIVLAIISFSAAIYITAKHADANGDAKTTIDFGAKAFFGAGGLVSLVTALQALHLNALRARISVSFEFLKRYDDADAISVRHFLDTRLPETRRSFECQLEAITPEQAKEFYLLTNSTEGMGARIRQLLGLFEDMALAVAMAHADELTLYRALKPSVTYFVARLAPYIRYERDRTCDVLYYEDSIKIACAWSEGKSVISGKPMRSVWIEPRREP